jgi:hypothetical protein
LCRHDTAFTIQCISRFALAYTLTTRNGLAPNATVISICNQGQSLDDLSVDDLSLKRRLAARPSAPALFMQQSKRDSTVLDSCFEVRSRSAGAINYHWSPLSEVMFSPFEL